MANNSQDGPRDSRPPRIGNDGPAVQIRFVRAAEIGEPTRPDSADPFVEVSPLDAPYRIYLAQAYVGGRPDPNPLSVYLEPNEFPEGRSNARGYWNQRQLDATWDLGFAAAAELGPDTLAPLTGFLRSAAGPSPAQSVSAPLHPPVAYCKRCDRYADVVCPTCLGALRTCRDDTVLQSSGLPPYTTGLDRFLHCATCTADPARATVFYTYSKQRTVTAAPGVEVRHREELYTDLAGRIQTSNPTLASHPCFVCKVAQNQLPEGRVLEPIGPDASSLYALSYYESRHWIRQAVPFSFEESAGLLGGAGLEELLALRPSRNKLTTEPGGNDLSDNLSSERDQFFFAGDRTGLFPVEVLHLKLSAITRLLRGAVELYETGRPFLSLSPTKVRGSFRAGAPGLPARWSLGLSFADALSTAPLQFDPPPANLAETWVVPEPRPTAYLPPEMHRTQSHSFNMRLDLEDLQVHGGGTDCKLAVRGLLVSDIYRVEDHGEHDLVRITLNSPSSGERLILDGRRTEVVSNGFRFEGVSQPIQEIEANAIRDAKSLGARSVDVTVFHTYSGPTDLYSLGLLILRLLFWNDAQTGNRIDGTTLKRIAARVVETHPGSVLLDWAELSKVLEEEDLHLGPDQVLYRKEDRAGANAIPDPLWSEIWLTTLRMISLIPNWSYADRLDDYPTEDPARPLRAALADFESIEDQVRGSMMGSSGRNSIMLEVCQDFLDDLREATSPSAPTGNDDIEMTMVVKPDPSK